MADETQVEILARMNDLLKEQVRLKRVLGEFNSAGIREASEAFDEAGKRSSSATESIKESAKSTEEFGDAADDAGKKSDGFFSRTFGQIKERSKAFVGAIWNMITSLEGLKSIFNILSGGFLLDGLIKEAMNLPLNTAFAQAREEAREFAGDLRSGVGKSIMTSFRTFGKSAQDFGLSMQKVYGFGPEGKAARLKDVVDLYQKLGTSITNFSEKLAESAGEIIFTGKALGIGNEGVVEFLRTAEAIGTDGIKYLRDFQKEGAKALSTYGISAKVMGRGMSELLKTLPHLAREGAKAFAPIVAYAQKMGLELKQVTGILDTFSSADKALEAASNLAQIGVALDPIELVAEKDPAKMLIKIGEAFKNSGKAVDLSDRHMRSYLKSTLQVDDATLDRIASENGLSDGYKKTMKNAEEARKKQMSQQEVMQELGKGIKRLIQMLDRKDLTGFFDALIKGFTDGAMNLGPMLKGLYSIKSSLLSVYHAGRQLGVLFMTKFPGIQEMIKGVVKLFDSKATQNFLSEIKAEFSDLTSGLRDPTKSPDKVVADFLERMKNGFLKFQKDTGSFWKNIMPGLKDFSKAMGPVIAGIISFIGRELVNGLKFLTNIVKNGFSKGGESGGGLLGDAGEVIKNLVVPVWEALKESAPLLWDAIVELFGTVWDTVYPKLVEWGNQFMDWMSETWDNLGESIENGWKGASSASIRLWESIKDVMTKVWRLLEDWFSKTAWPKISAWWDDLVDKWKPRIKDKLEEVKWVFITWLSEFKGVFGTGARLIAAEMAGLGNAGKILATSTIPGANKVYMGMIAGEKNKAASEREALAKIREQNRSALEAAREKQEKEEEEKRKQERVLRRKLEKERDENLDLLSIENAGPTKQNATDAVAAADMVAEAHNKLAEGVLTAGKKLTTGEGVAASAAVASLKKDFPAGKIQVSHSLPNTQVSFVISIDTQKLGEKLLAVNFGKDDKANFIQAGAPAASPVMNTYG